MTVNYYINASSSGGGVDMDEVLYEVEYQHTSGKVSKLPDPEGDKILVSTSNGDMEETTLTTDDITNKISKISNPKDTSNIFYPGLDGYIMVSTGDGGIKEGTATTHDFEATVWNKLEKYAVDNLAVKPFTPEGDKIIISKDDGGIKETTLTIEDITSKLSKIATPNPGQIMISKADGTIRESTVAASDFRLLMPKLQSPILGGKLVASKTDGKIEETEITSANVMGKIPKIVNAVGNRVVVSNVDGTVREGGALKPVTKDYDQLKTITKSRTVMLPIDRRTSFPTVINRVVISLYPNKYEAGHTKRLIVYRGDAYSSNWTVVNQFPIGVQETHKILDSDIAIPANSFYNFDFQVDASADNATPMANNVVADLISDVIVEWYYTEG